MNLVIYSTNKQLTNIFVIEDLWVTTIWIFSSKLPYIKKWFPIYVRYKLVKVKVFKMFLSDE